MASLGTSPCPRLCVALIENAMQGLDDCRKLRKLYLYSNRIRRIENLSHCSQLEILWLSDNQIVVLEGLEKLTMLRELNLARNLVDQIGDALTPNTRLEVLNLADNQVCGPRAFRCKRFR